MVDTNTRLRNNYMKTLIIPLLALALFGCGCEDYVTPQEMVDAIKNVKKQSKICEDAGLKPKIGQCACAMSQNIPCVLTCE